MKTKRHRSLAAAFTLVEMLTVMGIIAILAALLIPAVSTSRERSRIAYCANNLGQIGKALMSYMNDNKDRFPSLVVNIRYSAWDVALIPYLGGVSNVFACPSDPYRRSDVSIRTYSANGSENSASTNSTPFGSYNTSSPLLRFSDLDYNKSDIILIGERPGDSVTLRGVVGKTPFCAMAKNPGRVHNRGKGGNYLMGSMAVLFLETNKVAESELWTMHTE
jgi:prepilin-type N-terminal cleavage/methylation domain-containing protein